MIDIKVILHPTDFSAMARHALMGSTAEKVVRKAPCPVLTIRHPEHEFVHP